MQRGSDRVRLVSAIAVGVAIVSAAAVPIAGQVPASGQFPPYTAARTPDGVRCRHVLR